VFVSQRGAKLIMGFELLRLTPYICPAGYLTVGYGHLTNSREPITENKAELLLAGDLTRTTNAINKLIKVPLTQYQFDALVSFTFNTGNGALQRSTLRMKINRGEYHEAGDEFLKWIYGGGRKLKGLLRRRIIERKVFLGG
jgi:lysozyme